MEWIILKQKRTCSNCVSGTIIKINNDILCCKKGIVSPDYCCGKHKFYPKFSIENEKKCGYCKHFVIDDKNSDDIVIMGNCHLFSVRKFNGLQKNACSKYCAKTELEVSLNAK